MKAFLIAIFIFLSVTIFPQETQNKSKTIYLTHFNPYKSQKSDAIANKIFLNLEESFKANGFDIKESKSDLKTTLAIAKGNGAKFVVDGYYKLNESEGVNIYSQIYNPDTGYMIDALNVTDELSGIEGVTLDPNETKKTADSSIDELKKKIAIRVRTNTKRTERRENINDAIKCRKCICRCI